MNRNNSSSSSREVVTQKLAGVGGHALGGGGISTTQNSLLLLNPDTLQPITWEQVDVTKVTHVVCMSVDMYTPTFCVNASCRTLGRSFSFFYSVCLPLLMKTSTHIETQPFSISLPPPPPQHTGGAPTMVRHYLVSPSICSKTLGISNNAVTK